MNQSSALAQSAPQNDPVSTMLHNILCELQKQRIPDDLWTAEDVAVYLRLSVGTVRNRVLSHCTFPRAVRIPTTDDGGSRRWPAKEVRAWALRHRESVA